jgi:hypothetical protein
MEWSTRAAPIQLQIRDSCQPGSCSAIAQGSSTHARFAESFFGDQAPHCDSNDDKFRLPF